MQNRTALNPAKIRQYVLDRRNLVSDNQGVVDPPSGLTAHRHNIPQLQIRKFRTGEYHHYYGAAIPEPQRPGRRRIKYEGNARSDSKSSAFQITIAASRRIHCSSSGATRQPVSERHFPSKSRYWNDCLDRARKAPPTPKAPEISSPFVSDYSHPKRYNRGYRQIFSMRYWTKPRIFPASCLTPIP